MLAAPRKRFSFLTGGVALALTLVGCSSSTPGPRRPGEEWLKSIQVEGNKTIKDKTLVTGLGLRRTQQRGRAPDPYLVQVDEDRIRGEYLRKGFLSVDVRSRVETKQNATTVIYTVEEGIRARTRVVINGLPQDPELPVSKVRAALPLADNAPFEYEIYDEAKEGLKNVVEDAGYAHVKLDTKVVADRANHTAIVQLDYTTGPKSRFGPIEVTGIDGPLRDAVENRLQFEPGQQYSTAAIAATQRALYGLGRFSTVRVQPEKSDPTNPVVAMKVDVSEGARHEVKLGGGFGVDPATYEVRGRVAYSVAGWPFPMDTASIELRPAYAMLRDASGYEPRIRALAKLERQDVFWTYSKGEVEGGYNYVAYEAYTAYGPRARVGFSTPLGWDKLQLQVGWGIEQADFRNFHPLLDESLRMQLNLNDTEVVGAYTQAVSLDLRDHPLTPTLGAFAEVRVAEATKYAGSNYEYVQVVPEVRGYVPLLRGAVLAGKVRTGATFGDLAPTERFFSGGSSSHRGFSERKLAPSAIGLVDGDLRSIPYGGGGMLQTSIEARIPITEIKEMPLGGVVFLDGGDVTETYSDLDLGNLHWAAGIGARLLTIVGPVRADFGYRLNRKGGMNPDPDSKFAFHLSLGEAF
ncbi:MAG: surface antigen [Myxococcales bacterium]|nr:surface antigen [Myxococcales bacterium]